MKFIFFIFLIFSSQLYSNDVNNSDSDNSILKRDTFKHQIFNIPSIKTKRPENFYYFHPEKVGAYAFYNPIQLIVEGGFGALYNMKIDTFDWDHGFKTLHHSLRHPFDTIDKYGWKKFFYYEFIPHTGKGQNYTANWFWHFIGLGMRTRLLEEYYIYHKHPFPKAMSWLTAYTLHYFNEVVQAAKFKSQRGTVDPLPDLLFFDWLGAIFFSFDPINNFMTKYLHLTEWSFQTMLNPVTNRLINNGQIYWVRFEVWDPISLSVLTGEQISSFGLTYRFYKNHQISIGIGAKVKAFLAEQDGDTDHSSVVFDFGLYYSIDDNPFLVISYEPRDKENQKKEPRYYNEYAEKLIFNFYPGWLNINGFKPGVTISVQKEAFFIGFTTGGPVGFIFSTPQGQEYLDAY